MLPVAFHVPAGVVLLVAGLVACFAGYRLFRAVLIVYGFLLGALFAGSLVAPSNAPTMLIALVLGGIAGALVMFAGYVAGVMLVGAALGALVFHSFWIQIAGTSPSWLLVLLAAVVGAAAATLAQRVVVILATAFAGAHTAVAGIVALLAHRAALAPVVDDVWIRRLAPAPSGPRWPFFAWLALALAGTFVQLRGRPRRKSRRTGS
jgi:hypothetical protein